MFVVLGVQAWGSLDVQTTVAQVHEERKPGDDDLLDLACSPYLPEPRLGLCCRAGPGT
jgi:hypothetical protein